MSQNQVCYWLCCLLLEMGISETGSFWGSIYSRHHMAIGMSHVMTINGSELDFQRRSKIRGHIMATSMEGKYYSLKNGEYTSFPKVGIYITLKGNEHILV